MADQKTEPARILLKLAAAAFLLAVLSLVPGGMVMSDGGLTLFSICMLVATLMLAVYGLARVAGFVTK